MIIKSFLIIVAIVAAVIAVIVAEQRRMDKDIALFQVGVIIKEYIGDEVIREGRIVELNGNDEIIVLDYEDFEKYKRSIVGLIRTCEKTELVKDGQVIAIFGGTIE